MTNAPRDTVHDQGRHNTARLLRSSGVVGLGTVLSRMSGLLRVQAIAYALGVSTLAGVYSYANETPNMVYELLIGGVLTATLVPQFVRHFRDDDEEATSAVFTVALLALLAITVVGIIIAPWIVKLYTIQVKGPGRADQQVLATSFLRVFMPQMLFYGLTALASALLQARHRFGAAAFVPVLNNIVVIAIFVSIPRLVGGPFTVQRLLHNDGLMLLIGLGTTAGIAAMGLALLPALRAAKVRLRFLPAWRHAAVRRMLRLSGWTVGYVVANQIALWYVLIYANEHTGGAFAYLTAYIFFQLPYGLFAYPIMTAVAPELAAAGGRGDPPALRHRFARALRLALTVIIPAAAVAVALARPIIVAGLQRGAFSAGNAALVADTLVGFAVGLPFFCTYLFSLRAFYSLDDTRTPFLLGCFENAINILLVLALTLFHSISIPGLAFCYSGAYAAGTVLNLTVLSRRKGVGSLRGRGIGLLAIRVLAVSVAGAGVAWIVGRSIGWATSGTAIAATLSGLLAAAVVIVGGLFLLRVEEFTEVLALIRRRRARRSAIDAGPST